MGKPIKKLTIPTGSCYKGETDPRMIGEYLDEGNFHE
jgi:hypothetical protein